MRVAGARRERKGGHDQGGQRKERGFEYPFADGTLTLAPANNR
jgi:hypothetical protein